MILGATGRKARFPGEEGYSDKGKEKMAQTPLLTEDQRYRIAMEYMGALLVKITAVEIGDPIKTLIMLKMLAVYGLRVIQIVIEEKREPKPGEVQTYVEQRIKTMLDFHGLKIEDLPKM